jgi:2-amino-4-hydroxy-6-hydroxymethyldihydropteridine diphosphokinase
MSTIAYLGLGSNLGDRMHALRTACGAIVASRGIGADLRGDVADVFETSPCDVEEHQPNYLNTVLRVTTTLAPMDLLQLALQVEAALGRTRERARAPRTIDVDLLLFGDLVCDGPALTLPHPRLHLRRFVLEPLRQLTPDFVHPRLNVTIGHLADRLGLTDAQATVVPYARVPWFDPQ